MAVSIDPRTSIGFLTLKVADLQRSLDFYKDVIGFRVLRQEGTTVALGVDGTTPLLVLNELTGAKPAPVRATGLYHFAILVPTRLDLGRSLYRLAETRYPLGGSSDHLVSEALYLSDPDGNGIEIYRDRPRSEWHWQDSQVQMATDPLDLRGLLILGQQDTRTWNGLQPQTVIGHMHLQVANLDQAEAFYHGVLGFDITADLKAMGALFISAGGYHHHLGLNTWHSRNAPRPPADVAGLRSFTITLPDKEEKGRLAERLRAANIPFEERDSALVCADPWGNGLLFTVGTTQSLSSLFVQEEFQGVRKGTPSF